MVRLQPARLNGALVTLLSVVTFNIYTCYYIWQQAKFTDDVRGERVATTYALIGGITYTVGALMIIMQTLYAKATGWQPDETSLMTALPALWVVGAVISWIAVQRLWQWLATYEIHEMGTARVFSVRAGFFFSWIPFINMVTFPLMIGLGQMHLNRAFKHLETGRLD